MQRNPPGEEELAAENAKEKTATGRDCHPTDERAEFMPAGQIGQWTTIVAMAMTAPERPHQN